MTTKLAVFPRSLVRSREEGWSRERKEEETFAGKKGGRKGKRITTVDWIFMDLFSLFFINSMKQHLNKITRFISICYISYGS